MIVINEPKVNSSILNSEVDTEDYDILIQPAIS